MPPRDPYTLPKGMWRLPNMREMLIRAGKRPVTGVTQGGSGRRWPGALSAATVAQEPSMLPATLSGEEEDD